MSIGGLIVSTGWLLVFFCDKKYFLIAEFVFLERDIQM